MLKLSKCYKKKKLSKCLGVTDNGVRPLAKTHKLELLVEDCPQVSIRGVNGATTSVSFN